MSKAGKEALKKLSAYRKEEIIEALGRALELAAYPSEYIAEQMTDFLENKKIQDLLDRHEKALAKEIAAEKAFRKWKNEMCEKCGDGQTVRLSNIPPADIIRGTALEKALKEATEEEKQILSLWRKLDEMC